MQHQSLRIGIVGCGVITQRTLPGLCAMLSSSDKITGICDISAANLQAVADGCGNADVQRFETIETLLANGTVNTVLVATPISMHYDHVKQALLAGCHVYTHKTLAPSPEQCLELGQLAADNNLHLLASPGQVLLPAYQRAREIIDAGDIGSMVSIDAQTEATPHRYELERAQEDPTSDAAFSWEWYHQAACGGGPLDDMLVYPLAFLTELLGDVSQAVVKARLVTPEIVWRGRRVMADTPDAYSGLLLFGDVPVTIRASFSSNSARVPWGFISIHGTDACLEIEKCSDRQYRLYFTPNHGKPTVEQLDVFDERQVEIYGADECHVLVDIDEFLQGVAQQRAPQAGGADNAARVAQGIALIRDSSANGVAIASRGS